MLTYSCVHCKVMNPEPYPGATTCGYCGKDMTGGKGGEADPVSFGCFLVLAFWVVLLATPVVALVVVTSWWTMLGVRLRSMLELLPAGVVARTAGGDGQPFAVGGGVLVAVLVLVVVLSRRRRQAVHAAVRGESQVAAWWWGLLRSAVIVGGAPLALVVGVVASGGDLASDAAASALTAWWQVAAVVVLVVAYAWVGTARLGSRLVRRAERGPDRGA